MEGVVERVPDRDKKGKKRAKRSLAMTQGKRGVGCMFCNALFVVCVCVCVFVLFVDLRLGLAWLSCCTERKRVGTNCTG